LGALRDGAPMIDALLVVVRVLAVSHDDSALSEQNTKMTMIRSMILVFMMSSFR
jgi:hypothetical protein